MRNRSSLLAAPLQFALAILAILQCSGAFAVTEIRKTVSDSAPRLALVIGNTNYVKLGKLKNPGNDARLVAATLRQLGFEVTEVTDRDLKGLSQDVETLARKIRERGPETVALLYYAGHGLESDSVNYLVPVNADIKRRTDVAAQSLSVKRVADQLSAAGNQLNVLIIDACRDNPFPEATAPPATLGLVPMGAVYGVFIASSTGSGKAAFDGEDGHSPYTKALAEAITQPGEKLEDAFKSVRRQVRLATSEQQIPWESTSLETDFYFVPPRRPPGPAEQLLAAARESGNAALFDLLIERFPGSAEAAEAMQLVTKLRQAQVDQPAAGSAPTVVLARARLARTAEAFDLVASLFPDSPEARDAQAAAAALREAAVLNSAGPTFEGHELVQRIQEQLVRLDCMAEARNGLFEAATIQGLRRATLLTDDHFLWYRPTMAALRALKKVEAGDGCKRQPVVAAPRCLRINNEDFCQ